MFRHRLILEADGRELTGVLEQTNRVQILEALADLRNAGGAIDAEGMGRWALSVPFEDWQRLRALYPDLAATDAQTRSRAWLRFIQSDESKPFRMRVRI